RAPAAAHQPRRAAAAVEHPPGAHELHRAPPVHRRGGRQVRAVAAPPSEHEARADLPLADQRPQRADLRRVDAARPRVHRQLVVVARPQDRPQDGTCGPAPPRREVVPDIEVTLRREAARLAAEACGRQPAPRVPEAGCGPRAHVDLPPGARVVGVDRSRAQLRRNDGIAARVEGDVTQLPLASASVDVVVSWDVLEHVDDPAQALTEYRRVLRQHGIIVLGLPHVLSLKGLLTRLTPWPVHVWVYRRVLGDPTAGTDASDQFPTTMRLRLRPAGLRRLARSLGDR